MKKILFCVCFLPVVTLAQIVSIPDVNFKNKILASSAANNIALDASGNNTAADANGDGQIQLAEAQNIYTLNIESSGIASIEGILGFSNIKIIRCSYNQITSIDLSDLASLQRIECLNNSIHSLLIQGCTNLDYVDCSGNPLNDLDAHGLANLHSLWMWGPNSGGDPAGNLNVSNTGLNVLEFRNHNFNAVDISGCAVMTLFGIQNGSSIQSLDASGCTLLGVLSAAVCSLNSINLSGCINLGQLLLSNNNLSMVDITQCTGLTYVQLSNNQLTTLDVSNKPYLNTLDLTSNPVTAIDFATCPVLRKLDMTHTSITSIDVSQCHAMERLYLQSTLITSIDVSQCHVLQTLDIRGCAMQTVNVKNGAGELVYLDFSSTAYVCCDAFQIADILEDHPGLTVDAECSLGVSEFNPNGEVSVYPNPTKDFVTVRASTVVKSATLYDVHGRLLFSRANNAESVTLNLSELKAGTYFVEVMTERGSVVKKVIRL